MNKFALTLITCLLCVTALGQEQESKPRPNWEQLKAQKVAYLTQEVALTAAEAEKFWPVYNELEKEFAQIMTTRGRMQHYIARTLEKKSLKEPLTFEQMNAQYLETFTKESELRTKYHQLFQPILSAEKIARLYLAEERFNNKTLKDFILSKSSK